MKKSIFLAAITLTAFTADARQTLRIIEQDYELAKRTAAQQQKLLIIDFYTTWCIPCKVLDKTIFQNDNLADEISKRFVVLKYDAERDTVHNLSLKHHVCSYPTTAVLTADGRLIRKMFGTGSGGSLVENYRNLLRESTSLNNQGEYLTGYTPTIQVGQYPDFYKNYVRRIANIKPGDLEKYWSGNKDLLTEVSFDILSYFGKAPKHVIDFFIQNKAEYEKRFGKEDVRFVMNNMVSDQFSAAIEEKDTIKYEAATAFARQHLTVRDAAEYLKVYELEMQLALGKWDEASRIVEERIRLKTISENGINRFCWSVYEQCTKELTIVQAAQFMKELTDANPSFATLDTYARLLAKSGSSKEALVVMKRAIELGKANGEDTKESEEALSKF